MREGERTGELIWLRQSATFTVDGQTRTLELEIPVRPGASPEEVEALLAQAEGGMARLSSALDAHVASALAGRTPPPLPASSPVSASAPAEPRPAAPLDIPLREERREAAEPPKTSDPREVALPTTPIPTPRPTAPAARPAPSGSAASGSAPVPAHSPAAPTGPEISRQEFLAATGELGLNPKEAMDRLGVRSLAGLNLREALESLRRQMLRGGAAAEASMRAERTEAPRAEPARRAPERPAPQSPPAPAYFEEEDEGDITFTVSGEDEFGALAGDATPLGEPDEDAGASFGYGEPDGMDEFDLDDDVPDFGPPPGTAARASAPAAPARPPTRASRPTPATAPEAAEAPRGLEAATARGAANTRAAQLLAQLRAAHAGGAATSQQRTAYRNIIVAELGEASARALVQGIWKATPERLGMEQYDELIRWGKQDTFAEEAKLVQAALIAEREAAAREAERAKGTANGAATGTRSRSAPARGDG